MQSFKQLLSGGEVVPVFAVGRLLHPVVIEMFHHAGGYKGFWIDGEHVTLSTDQIFSVSMAGRARGMDNFVRIPPTGYWQVTQCLEAGAGGVMAAQIHTADQAREFVSWTKFSPQGTRGLNSGGYDANFTHKPPAQFIEDANRDHFVAIQIETAQSVEEVDEIAAIEGVDLLFVGPADLSLSLGVVGQFHHDKLWQAIGKVSQACANNGIPWGAVTPDPEWAQRAIENGCRLPTMGNEVHGLRKGIAEFRSAFGESF